MSAATMTEREAAKLSSRVEQQVREEATLVEEIASLRARETEAVQAALREGSPTRGPLSKTEGIRKKREAAERKLATIREFELPAAHQLAVEAQEALRLAKLEQGRAAARPFDQIESEAIARMAVGYEEFLRGYAAFAEAASGREAVHAELQNTGLLNGLGDGELWKITLEFQSTLNPFPTSPAAMFEAVTEAVLDPHAGDPQYEAELSQRYPTAAAFVSLLAGVREEGLYRRTRLRLSDNRTAIADQSSGTNDRAGGMAGSGFFS
jgi:hypothetical protein